MSKGKIIGCIFSGIVVITAVTAKSMSWREKKIIYRSENIKPVSLRRMGFYEKYVKRVIDVVCATGAIIVCSPLYLGVALLVKIKLGSPVLFTQDRPGLVGAEGKETIFKMYKFRAMTDERDKNGELLPDDMRLTKFGKWLRNTSLEGNDIIRQTTKSLINKGFREVSPIDFFNGCNLISNDFKVMIA